MKPLLTDHETLYKALINRDSSFEGVFIAGVKTTGIFCRPTCTARKPKRENVEFFGSAQDALLHGYRPCRVCKPMEHKGAPPKWLKPLLDEVTNTPHYKLKDSDLRKRGFNPSRVRYWFKEQHGMTFQGYMRALRIGKAFGRIRHGSKVADTAFDSGYQSLSGFTDSFKKTADFPPSKSTENHIIPTTRILTPLGPMLAAATEYGICLLEFIDRRMLETEIKRLSKRLNARFVPGSSRFFDNLKDQLDGYFSGNRTSFDIPLVAPGTEFQKKVWAGLQTIPFGATCSYKQQAQAIGQPTAVRAVAKANGDNSIAILIPCHRVVGVNGELVGYGGGLWRKQYLLNHESGNL
ncbi:MAG TPA: XRE family transcriptional regulator [Anaerolineae bacterium]|nr:XRE family transcriptional regulator [Anaerolineae bacterium]